MVQASVLAFRTKQSFDLSSVLVFERHSTGKEKDQPTAFLGLPAGVCIRCYRHVVLTSVLDFVYPSSDSCTSSLLEVWHLFRTSAMLIRDQCITFKIRPHFEFLKVQVNPWYEVPYPPRRAHVRRIERMDI